LATGLADDEVVDDVDELWRRRIIVDLGATYDFSHDKLRAVALETVSPARRRQLHRAVAEAIQTGSSSPDALAAQLAAHYDQAGLIEPAVDAYRRAGVRAVAVSSLDEAVTMFRQGLTVLADMPPSLERDAVELDLRIALGSPLVAVEGYGAKDAHQLYERARVLSRKLNRTVEAPILRGLGLARLQGCRFDDADEMSRALVEHEGRDPAARTEGHYLLGVSAFWRGDLTEARRNLEAALAGYEPSHLDEHLTLYAQDPQAICLVRLAWVELWEGNPRQADEHARAALALADDLDHQMTSAYVGIYAAVIAAESEDLGRLAELLDYLDAVWSRLPMPYLMILGDALRGWLEVNTGAAEGIERIVQSSAAVRREGETLHLSYSLLLLARARGRAGELREGRAAATEALALSEQWSQRYLEAELLRVHGELAYRSGETDVAADSLRGAVQLADTQGARWLKLRALHSLVSRFPEPTARTELAQLLEAVPSGRELPPFRAANDLLASSD
jgi:tetratricopeptide (TPR) repeat protein